ncbi:MAG TPA: iron-sulfur cluster repair di-iron protein, partial [Planctomycetes bacterium]|nr:iron-sulfur cluster repair di-iron protein [Planctomycetota bacterium]
AFLKTELPRLTQLVRKVADVHDSVHPELHDVRTVFAELRSELEPHMMKEENILFPAIRLLEQSMDCPRFPFGTVANPIRMMEHEHDNAGNALKRIRELTQDFLVPVDACNTWRTMLDGLQNLERDLHRHIHKENSILFPRAEQLNAARIGSNA